MADKKSTKQDEFASSRAEKTESPADFLARVGVTRQMQDVISLILENRPEDPVAYIAEYFANIAEHVPSVTQAYQHLCLSHHSEPHYENNVLKAFAVLNRQKFGQGLKGLTGKSYNELLAMLCRDIASNEADTLLNMLQKQEQEVVRFNDFSSGVSSCFLCKDFISQAKLLFQELDLSGRGTGRCLVYWPCRLCTLRCHVVPIDDYSFADKRTFFPQHFRSWYFSQPPKYRCGDEEGTRRQLLTQHRKKYVLRGVCASGCKNFLHKGTDVGKAITLKLGPFQASNALKTINTDDHVMFLIQRTNAQRLKRALLKQNKFQIS